jgi:CubicO group peptidase (beta-lactamase class C family)
MRTHFLVIPALLLAMPAMAQERDLQSVLEEAERLEPLETVIVSVDGAVVAEQGFKGNATDEPTNIKSASKSVVSALVGMAIDRGLIESVDQPIADFLADDFPDDADPRLDEITVGNLLSMQAGLEPTSGPNYGRWVASGNWVRFALAQPFETDPGGRMLYSTGSTHLLSAILTEVTGEPTRDIAEEWFAPVDDFGIGGWERDPQGIYLGGNQMAMTPRSLLAFGEVYRTGGLAPDGTRILPEEWVEQSWTERTNSRFSGDGYGYGWFLRDIAGEAVRFGWGYGGQMIYVVPPLELTVAMTSDENSPSAGNGHRDALHELLGEIIVAVRNGDEEEDGDPSP